MKQFFIVISFSFVISAANVVVLDVVQARELTKATDRLTAPQDDIEPTAPGSHTYELSMSKDNKLCSHMLKLFNDDFAKYGYEQYREHTEFTKIPWRDIRFPVPGTTGYIPAEGGLFDFNNDGIKEFVVRWGDVGRTKGRMDQLSMLDSEAAKRAEKLTHKEAFESKNMINPEGWTYLLLFDLDAEVTLDRATRTAWENIFFLRPFLFDDKAYLYMRPRFASPVTASDSEPSYAIVARYLGGRIDIDNSYDGKLDDLCYFKHIRTVKRLPN